MNTHVNGATANSAKLDNGTIIPCYTLIWTAGVTPSKLIADLPCGHDKGHRIIANNYLEVSGYEDVVYALGDCASITDPHTGKPYPPTAQHGYKTRKGSSNEHNFCYKRKRKKRRNEKDKEI